MKQSENSFSYPYRLTFAKCSRVYDWTSSKSLGHGYAGVWHCAAFYLLVNIDEQSISTFFSYELSMDSARTGRPTIEMVSSSVFQIYATLGSFSNHFSDHSIWTTFRFEAVHLLSYEVGGALLKLLTSNLATDVAIYNKIANSASLLFEKKDITFCVYTSILSTRAHTLLRSFVGSERRRHAPWGHSRSTRPTLTLHYHFILSLKTVWSNRTNFSPEPKKILDSNVSQSFFNDNIYSLLPCMWMR